MPWNNTTFEEPSLTRHWCTLLRGPLAEYYLTEKCCEEMLPQTDMPHWPIDSIFIPYLNFGTWVRLGTLHYAGHRYCEIADLIEHYLDFTLLHPRTS